MSSEKGRMSVKIIGRGETRHSRVKPLSLPNETKTPTGVTEKAGHILNLRNLLEKQDSAGLIMWLPITGLRF